jgi:hypothetical protein
MQRLITATGRPAQGLVIETEITPDFPDTRPVPRNLRGKIR